MSEYQYYEFRAIDRPLSRQQIDELRALTTRATITPTRFVNVYHWGDFKGDPLALMKRYYDAFLYTANWGTHKLMLRVPRAAFDPATLRPYLVLDESFTVESTKEHLIFTFDSNSEEADDWGDEEDEEWLTALLPARTDLIAGDLRGLYLGWLLSLQQDDLDDNEVEPPVPPGLGQLPVTLEALVDFLRIDQDLLQAAAEGSNPQVQLAPSPEAVARWVDGMSEQKKEELLCRLAVDDARQLQGEVLRQIRSLAATAAGDLPEPRRRVGELVDGWNRQRRQREEQDAREQARRRAEEAAARAVYLDSLVGREDEIWSQVDTLIEFKRRADYIEATKLLEDLQKVAHRQNQPESFELRLKDLRARNSRRPSLMELLDQAGLRPGG